MEGKEVRREGSLKSGNVDWTLTIALLMVTLLYNANKDSGDKYNIN